jgi:hypothetical protein
MPSRHRRRTGTLLLLGGFVALGLGIAIVAWVVQPTVFPDCLPTDIACDPTGDPETDEKVSLRMSILGIATVIAFVLIRAGRRLREP